MLRTQKIKKGSLFHYSVNTYRFVYCITLIRNDLFILRDSKFFYNQLCTKCRERIIIIKLIYIESSILYDLPQIQCDLWSLGEDIISKLNVKLKSLKYVLYGG